MTCPCQPSQVKRKVRERQTLSATSPFTSLWMDRASALSTLYLLRQHSSEFFADHQKAGTHEVWTPRGDIPGLTVAIWDGGSSEIPERSIIVAPEVDQGSFGYVIQSLADAVDVVVCDLQGTANIAMLRAIHYADLVLIPVHPSNDNLVDAPARRPGLRTATRRSKPMVESMIAQGFVTEGPVPERVEPDDMPEGITIEYRGGLSEPCIAKLQPGATIPGNARSPQ